MSILQTIEARKSTRGFKPDAVPGDKLDAILKAGGQAPVGMGKFDGIHFTVIHDKALLSEISDAATKGSEREGQDIYYGAPVVIVISSAAPPFPGLEFSNAGAITQTFLLAATALELGSVYIFGSVRGFAADPGLLAKAGIPDGFKVVSSVALGYAADETAAAPKVPRNIAVNTI